MERQYLKRTWVSPKLRAGKSKIHEDGVIANEKISEGEKLMEFGGESISKKEAFSENYRERSAWIVSPNRYLALPNTDTEESLDENINHSCDANAWLVDEVTVVARKDIKAGEEITLDQGTWNFEHEDFIDNHERCSCGEKNCRKVLTENDWKIPSVQKQYKNHFHPMIQKMIASTRLAPSRNAHPI